MTELKQLKADLATLEAAKKIVKYRNSEAAFILSDAMIPIHASIAALEAQEAQVDPWAEVKRYIDAVSDKATFKQYIRHLEAKVAELDHELRCERIDGGKVRDDRNAISAEQNRQELAKLTTILNAIPPACGLARELVEKRIESVKREMQGNGN